MYVVPIPEYKWQQEDVRSSALGQRGIVFVVERAAARKRRVGELLADTGSRAVPL